MLLKNFLYLCNGINLMFNKGLLFRFMHYAVVTG